MTTHTVRKVDPVPSAARAWALATWALAIVLIVAASIFRGGNRHVAMIGLEWIGLAVCLIFAMAAVSTARLPTGFGQNGIARWGVIALLMAPAWVALAQLMGAQTVSTPLAGWSTALVGAPIVALLLVGLSSARVQTETLWKTWLWVALAQATLGLMQMSGIEALYFNQVTSEHVIGTFASKNTYANLLVMAIPLAVYGWIGRDKSHRNGEFNRQQSNPWLWGAALFVLMAAVSMSASRTAIVTGLLTVLLSVALLTPSHNSKGNRTHGRRWVWLGTAALLGAVALSGGLDWLARFDSARLASDDAARGLMREASWQGAMASWPWGSGLGSYRWVFPAFHPPELARSLVDLAHNDYLHFFMEAGAAGAALMVLILMLIGLRAKALWHSAQGRAGGWSDQDRLAVACGLGFLATALHAWVDYPFHIPANAMFAAFLLGVFLRESVPSQNLSKRKGST